MPFKGTLKSFLPLKDYFIQNRWPLIAGLFCLLLVDFLQLLIPLIIKRAIDDLTLERAVSGLLFKYSLTIMIIALSMALFRYVWRYFLIGHSRKVEEMLRNRLYSHLQTLSPSFYQRTKTGDLMARSINDLNAIRMATGMGVVALTDGLVLGTAAIGFMLHINIYLTIISLIPAPIIIYLTRVLTHRMSTGYEDIQKIFSELTEKVRETFSGIRIVKAYAREPWEYDKIEKKGKEYIAANMRLTRTIALFFPLMAIFTNLGLAIVIWMGGRLTIQGHISTGDFVAFASYLNLLTWPMMAMGWVTNLLQRGSASMRRITRVLDEVPEITGPPLPGGVPKIKGDIEFRRLSLKYQGQTEYALKDINFTIKSGKTIALVGRVGSGKTTFLYTIPHLIKVPAGTLFIDGTDIHHIPLKILRKSVGFVTQESIIFSDTIRNNVVFGRTEVPEETLKAALKAAQIHEEVLTFERGLDTMLGERGITLSGGQRQRLTIARALLSDPPVLILDDALSMVDTATEEKILNRVLRYRRHKTNLIVSHRLSTILRADHTLVLKNGELVEEGDHGTLMGMGMEYARLYKRQLLAQELQIEVT